LEELSGERAMDERIIKFVSALRAAGVRISLAESADAFRAIDHLGIKDREKFRVSLQASLVKDSSDLPIFAELFPLFFGRAGSPPMTNLSDDLDADEARMLADALHQFSDQIREMLERLVEGEQLRPDELQRLGKLVGLSHADDLRYLNWMTQRMEKALRFREVREALQELADLLAQMGMNRERLGQLQNLLHNNMQGLEDQLRQYAGQTIAENMSRSRADDGLDRLMNQPFNSLSDQDMERLRKEVQRLAAALRTRIALRQKRSRTGQLDAKATLRSNLKHGSVPIEIKHRDRTLKPRLVVLCDISTSMRFCSELMLSLLYALQDQISKTYSFAFIDHLEFISPDFEGQDSRKAVHQVLERMPSGYYNTDLGFSLENFTKRYLDTVDSRTTFLIVGDGRNNYNDPRIDLFKMLARRSRRTIWLTPEGVNLWGIGDSDMLEYNRECDIVLPAASLAQLTAAVDKLLTLG
jgi:uncharacterized protein with von Willebrand factor type A (vWA) domain